MKDPKDLSTQELLLEAYGQMLCPFPRLEAIRAILSSHSPNLTAIDFEEYKELVNKEAELFLYRARCREELEKRIIEENKES